MSKSRFFVWACLCFALGIFVGSYFNIPQNWLIISLAPPLIIGALFYRPNQSNRLSLTGLLVAVVILGAIRVEVSFKPNQFQSWFDSQREFEAIVVSDIDLRDNRQDFKVRPQGFSQLILVSVIKSIDIEYGDHVLVSGKIQEPKVFDDFDYKAYLERYQTYAVSRYPKVIVLKKHQGNFFKAQLLKIRQNFVDRIGRVLPEPQASLLLGILLGARKTLPQDVIDNFNATGLSHIIAISGYNIMVIIGALEPLARWLGRRASLGLGAGIIVAFVVITGASASVVRAAIMGAMLLLSYNIGRLYSAGPALSGAAVAMLLINPRILFWDVGFQLSFLATVGLMSFLPLFQSLSNNVADPIGLKTIMLSTFSVMLMTMPLILAQFSRLSIVAPLANLLVLPLVPATMLFGFLTALPGLGWGFGLISRGLLSYMINISAWLAGWPYSSLQIEAGPELFLSLSLLTSVLYLALRIIARRKVL